MKDEYGFPICINDIRRRPDLTHIKRNHQLLPIGVAEPTHWKGEKGIHLCVDCRHFVNDEGEFLNTI